MRYFTFIMSLRKHVSSSSSSSSSTHSHSSSSSLSFGSETFGESQTKGAAAKSNAGFFEDCSTNVLAPYNEGGRHAVVVFVFCPCGIRYFDHVVFVILSMGFVFEIGVVSSTVAPD